jgi:hypothetical protein
MSNLKAACLPFVTRSLRRGRLRRTALLSVVLAALSIMLGTCLALGSGAMEREIRVGLDLEPNDWERGRAEFVVVAYDQDEHEMLELEKERILSTRHEDTWGRIQWRIDEGAATLRAATSQPSPRAYVGLHARASALLVDRAYLTSPDRRGDTDAFSWNRPADVSRLRAVVDARLVPTIERYSSPLGTMDAVRLSGLIAGGALAVFLLVLGPMLVGMQLAQEVHENTLMPLTGTSLSSRQLAIGLCSGPLAVVGILAVPQILLVLAAASIAGYVTAALGLLVIGLVGCALLTTICMLLALSLGRTRTPGVVGISLLALLSGMLAIGLGIGATLEDDTAGLVAMFPQVGIFHLWREAFAPAGNMGAWDAMFTDLSLAFGTVGFVVLASLGLRAVERRIALRPGPSLGRWEALVGATTAIVLTSFAVSEHLRDGEAFYLITLALMAVPLSALLMSRVPLGDVPASLRVIPLRSLLAGLVTYLLIHLAVTTVLVGGPAELHLLAHPVVLLHLGWAVLVAALLSVRVVAVPMKIASMAWAGLCALLVVISYVHACVWASEHAYAFHSRPVFALWEASPLLGLLQVGLMVWVPYSLIRTLRRQTAGLG